MPIWDKTSIIPKSVSASFAEVELEDSNRPTRKEQHNHTYKLNTSVCIADTKHMQYFGAISVSVMSGGRSVIN